MIYRGLLVIRVLLDVPTRGIIKRHLPLLHPNALHQMYPQISIFTSSDLTTVCVTLLIPRLENPRRMERTELASVCCWMWSSMSPRAEG